MYKRKFTVTTQLHEANNTEIITYFEQVRGIYSQAVRLTFHRLKRDNNFNKSKFNTYLQSRFGFTKRMANSVISDAQSRLNAPKELKQTEVKQLKNKISHLENIVIPNTKNKRSLVAKKARLNKYRQKLAILEKRIEDGDYRICFGTKHLLKRDLSKFREQRDSQISFVGCKSETAGNQTLQLAYNNKTNQFVVKLRKMGKKTAYVYGKVFFNHHKQHIIEILHNKTSPLTYNIIKRNGRYYLTCTFEILVDKEAMIRDTSNGVIGVDFNKGFISVAETNQYGHLVSLQRLHYRFSGGNKTTSDLQVLSSKLAKLCYEKHKPLVIENLNFAIKKSNTEKRRGKKCNSMLHSFPYKQFSEYTESACYRNSIYLYNVNPAWTSYQAKHKYCEPMKLDIHNGAALVIALRGVDKQNKTILQ